MFVSSVALATATNAPTTNPKPPTTATNGLLAKKVSPVLNKFDAPNALSAFVAKEPKPKDTALRGPSIEFNLLPKLINDDIALLAPKLALAQSLIA